VAVQLAASYICYDIVQELVSSCVAALPRKVLGCSRFIC
jgi:hypothetical protein